jgi:hypothetical protein
MLLKKSFVFMKVDKRCDVMPLNIKLFFMKAGKRCYVMHLFERFDVMLLKIKLCCHESR